MSMREWRLLRWAGIAFTVLYFAAVGILALLKATTPLFALAPWTELVYGPALTFGCSFLLLAFAVWIEDRIRGRD